MAARWVDGNLLPFKIESTVAAVGLFSCVGSVENSQKIGELGACSHSHINTRVVYAFLYNLKARESGRSVEVPTSTDSVSNLDAAVPPDVPCRGRRDIPHGVSLYAIC